MGDIGMEPAIAGLLPSREVAGSAWGHRFLPLGHWSWMWGKRKSWGPQIPLIGEEPLIGVTQALI